MYISIYIGKFIYNIDVFTNIIGIYIYIIKIYKYIIGYIIFNIDALCDIIVILN